MVSYWMIIAPGLTKNSFSAICSKGLEVQSTRLGAFGLPYPKDLTTRIRWSERINVVLSTFYLAW